MRMSFSSFLSFSRLQPHIETLAAGLAGSTVFLLLGLPTPTLSGAMVGVALLLPFRRKVAISNHFRDFGMLISGMAMGAAVTPEMLQGFQRYPLSLMLFCMSLSVGMFLSYLFLRIVGRWDRDTAFFACVPGALSVVLSMASDTKANLAKISIAQSFRLFLLFAVLPSLVTLQGAGVSLPVKSILGPVPFLLTLLAAGLVAIALKWCNFAAPWIFGGMIVSAVSHASGITVGDIHPMLTQTGFFLVGTFIGTRFAGIARENFFSLLAISFGSICIGLAITVLSAILAQSFLNNVTFGQALVAFAPGALEGMVILGAALALDPIYVGLHHLVRFIGIGFILPVGYAIFSRKK
jgi:uncharacterized protein